MIFVGAFFYILYMVCLISEWKKDGNAHEITQFQWMQWLTKQLWVFYSIPFLVAWTHSSSRSAWLGQKVFGASGAETFVALWSPWFGQANSALLIAPYIPNFTESEIAAVMATCE